MAEQEIQMMVQEQPLNCQVCRTCIAGNSDNQVVRLKPCRCTYCKDCIIVLLARSLVTAKTTMLATLTCQVCDEDATVDHLATPQNAPIAASNVARGNEPSPTDPNVTSLPPRSTSKLPVESRKSSNSKASVISAKKSTLKKQTRGRPTKKPFEDRLEELKRYKQRNNHCYVPMTNNEGERSVLSEWCKISGVEEQELLPSNDKN